jgi:hypothetical protein
MYVLGITASATAASIPDFALGTIGANVTSDGIKVYKYIKYDTGGGSVAAVADQVAYYYTLDGYKNHTVTSDLSDSVEIGAGVLQSAPGDGEYGWIQIKGPATLNLALTAGADGDPLTPTGAGADGTLDVSAAVTDNVCAIAGDISDKEVVCDFPL